MRDARLWSDLADGRFAFLDAGCGSGGSLDHCARRFARKPGLGLECDEIQIELARRRGYEVAYCDLRAVELPPRCVQFTAMVDVLEHLPDRADARRLLAAAARASRDFLFIRHPSFDDIEYLARLGLKLTWTDWAEHTNPMRRQELTGMLEELGWRDYAIAPHQLIADSDHPAVVPLDAPRDTRAYDPMLHGPKPTIRFDRVLHGKHDIFVRLNPDLDDPSWRRVSTADGWESVWEPWSARTVLDERESRRRRALGPALQPEGDTLDLLDKLLWRQIQQHADPLAARREVLREIVFVSACEAWRHLLNLLHVINGFNLTSGVRRVLGLGRRADLPGAFLAARFPRLDVTVVPSDPPYDVFTLSNLRIRNSGQTTVDGGGFDFVFALDETSADREPEDRWQKLVQLVAPGGWLHLALVPGGDEALASRCEDVLRRSDHDELRSARAFSTVLSHGLEGLRVTMPVGRTGRLLANLVRLGLHDLQPIRAHGLRESDAVIFNLRRRPQ